MTDNGFSTNKLVYLAVGTDDRDSSKRSIFLDQPSFGLSREFLVKGLDEAYVKHYFTYMKSAARLLGAPQTERTERELKETLLFEIELAQISGMDCYNLFVFFLELILLCFRCKGGQKKRVRAL